MDDLCTDNRFELIKKYRQRLIEATNVADSPEEMDALDSILFRFWQMGWLDKLEQPERQSGRVTYQAGYADGYKSAQPEPQWIPCSERLPDKPIRVQTQLDNEWIVTAYYYDNAWYTVPDLGQELKNDEVIAWMPLPEPWRGEEHEQDD